MIVTAKRVLVALSGGVDSSVCVHLLKEQGYDVTAAVLNMSDCHKDTVEAAKQAAESLNIELHVLDMQAEFERNVITYFIDEYQNGRTPNPCIICNPTVKFKAMISLADQLSCEYVATGHYARLDHTGDRTKLLRGECLKRDQSYMLYRLDQTLLSRLMFPLAHLEKSEVREIASNLGLSCATKPDSQENCFIADNDYAKYIETRCGKSKVGDFISPEGVSCGKHCGVIHYTVGQRKGLGVALGRPVFIKEIDPVQNKIYLADFGGDTKSEVKIIDINTISGIPFEHEFFAEVKIRSTAIPAKAKVIPVDIKTAQIIFETPLRAVAKGQSVVIYDGDEVLGGGFIS